MSAFNAAWEVFDVTNYFTSKKHLFFESENKLDTVFWGFQDTPKNFHSKTI